MKALLVLSVLFCSQVFAASPLNDEYTKTICGVAPQACASTFDVFITEDAVYEGLRYMKFTIVNDSISCHGSLNLSANIATANCR